MTVALLQHALTGSAWVDPDSVVTDRPDWFQVVSPSTPYPHKNVVYRCLASGDEVEARIQQVISTARANGSGLRWVVTPGCEPADLGERLLAHGLTRDMDAVGMTAPTDLAVDAPPDVAVEPLTEANADDVAGAWAAGWSVPLHAYDILRRDVARILSGAAGPVTAWLSRLDGAPAGTGLIKRVPGSGLLQGASVDPAYRGRGAFRALVARRLAALAADGVPVATVLAQADTSAPVLERLGFTPVCRFAYYVMDAPG